MGLGPTLHVFQTQTSYTEERGAPWRQFSLPAYFQILYTDIYSPPGTIRTRSLERGVHVYESEPIGKVYLRVAYPEIE